MSVPRTKQNQVEKVEQYITHISLLKASGTELLSFVQSKSSLFRVRAGLKIIDLEARKR